MFITKHRRTHELAVELATEMTRVLGAHELRISKLEKQLKTNKKKTPVKKARR